MATAEIDEVELMRLRQIAGAANKVYAHPEGRKLLEKAHKLVDPNAVTPALDQEDMINKPINEAVAQVKALQDELKAEREERKKAESLAALSKVVDDGFAKLRESGWQKEGIEAVDALMKEKGILDPMIAAAYIEKTMPPQQPAAPSGVGAWNFIGQVQDGEADLKKLIESKGDYEPLIDKMAHEALSEFRGTSRR